MASLYDEGWRQGSIINHPLSYDVVVRRADDVGHQGSTHERWLVVTQDCDLDMMQTLDVATCVELRPILTTDPPTELGIRSRRFKLSIEAHDRDHLNDLSFRCSITPAALSAVGAAGGRVGTLDTTQRLRLTTWLGRRYDRPAVPPHLLPLMRHISDLVKKRRHRLVGKLVRDVLVQVGDKTGALRYTLVAIIENASDDEDVRVWLAGLSQEVPLELGVADRIEVGTAEEISIDVVETSYAADLSDLTWREGVPDGAH